jgi:hypothetical protein
MNYPHSHANGTQDLLARITREQASLQPRTLPQPMPRPAATAPQKKAKSAGSEPKQKKEPNTTTIHNSDGTKSYRVQIRGSVNGKLNSLCRTFSSLTIARAWRKRTIAEIELNGFPVPEVEADVQCVADILKARLDKDKKIECSARQYLRYLSKHPIWQAKRCSDLSVSDLVDFAEAMVAEDREPQTVAGYMSLLATTLKRARKRGAPVPLQVMLTFPRD